VTPLSGWEFQKYFCAADAEMDLVSCHAFGSCTRGVRALRSVGV
jgi:hypothetical protein